MGNKWSLVAGRLPGRTDKEIKNYWNTRIKRKLISSGIDPQTHRPLYPATATSDVCLDFRNSTHPMGSDHRRPLTSSVDDNKCNSSTTEESQPSTHQEGATAENAVLDLDLSIGFYDSQHKYGSSASLNTSSAESKIFYDSYIRRPVVAKPCNRWQLEFHRPVRLIQILMTNLI